MLKRKLIDLMLLPLFRMEIPGWGLVYKKFIGSSVKNEYWGRERPKIIRDKRNGYFRIVDMSEWADRSLYFLGRWYDLPAALLVDALVKDGCRVLDVGANYGHFSLAAAQAVGMGGSVVSFEPNPIAFARLSMHLELNKLKWVKPKNVGISDKEGKLVLKVPSINSGEATFGVSKYDDVNTLEVPVLKLDCAAGDGSTDFIKIDVEGYEAHVVRGAQAILEPDPKLS